MTTDTGAARAGQSTNTSRPSIRRSCSAARITPAALQSSTETQGSRERRARVQTGHPLGLSHEHRVAQEPRRPIPAGTTLRDDREAVDQVTTELPAHKLLCHTRNTERFTLAPKDLCAHVLVTPGRQVHGQPVPRQRVEHLSGNST